MELNLEKLNPKIDSIARCLERIEEKKPFTLVELQSDFDLQDIISTNVSRIVQLCVDVCTMVISRSNRPIPGDMAECFTTLAILGWITADTAIKMRKSVGMRNVMIHEYEKINWEVIYRVTQDHMADIKEFVRQVIAHAKP